MKQSHLFTKTIKDISAEETSTNAKLLIRAGYIDKLMAGVYSYLPLGFLVLNKIKNIIREEMNNLGAQEIYMPALIPKENWEKTGRWKEFDVLFRLSDASKKEYALGATHEEVVTPLLRKFLNSYKDLPCAVYQIQDKFRAEKRAKSGLLRGREFSMKDLYSFHANEEDMNNYYETVKEAYTKIFTRCGLNSLIVEASGGTFSKFSHEFQVLTDNGEDITYCCSNCGRHQNKEIADNINCPYCGKKREIKKSIEIGNIFKLKDKYSKPFDLYYVDKNGKKEIIQMGCYGIGPSRIMGAIVEVNNDKDGIIWPREVAPYDIHLLNLCKKSVQAEALYKSLQKQGFTVLFDDRDFNPGKKLKEADLIGLPIRLIISDKTENKIEIKKRNSSKIELISIDSLLNNVQKYLR
jgi:prolyl-tRNA synthetase